ncbi:UNVERIFIED_CONTAM: Phosphomevalonate kinase, partial [Eudyptes robustus]
KGPKILVGFSGKRKSGKDYVSDELIKKGENLGLRIVRRGVSYPLKEEYGVEHNLDGERLKFDFEYKEKVRKEMVVWGEQIRSKDPAYFCRKTVEAVTDLSSVDILIISDCRRPTDLLYFKSHFNAVFLRVEADIETRKERGWEFQDGVDNSESECGLDDYKCWDFLIENNGDEEQLQKDLDELIHKLGVLQ